MTYRELVIRVPVPVINLDAVKEWIADNKVRIVLITKIAVPAILLAVLPFGTVKPHKAKKPHYTVRFNKGALIPVAGIEVKKVEMQWGEIKVAEALASERAVIARERAVPDDPDLDGKRAVYARIADQYGISPALLEAVHQVESGKSWGSTNSSYAGASGPMQFLPSTFRHYADAGWDIQNPEQAIEAAARLLSANGAAEGDVDSALLAYNHSWSYVEHVKRIAESI